MAITLDGTNGITTETGTGDVSVGDDLIFTGTGNRITGDFSNATVANRIFFQSSTTNGATHVNAFPNGTGTSCSFRAYSTSDPDNSSIARVAITNAAMTISSEASGTGTNQPMTFYTGGSERMRIDSSGNLLVGKTAPNNSERLGVKSAGNTSSTYGARFDNSSATAIFMLRDDGYLRAPTTYNLTGGTANLSIDASGFITRSTSSLRYKRDIETYNKGLSAVANLRPVFYKSSVADANGTIPDTQFAGLIAEELDEAGFSEFVEYNDQGQPDAVRYGNMVSLAFKAIQEQQTIIESLQARIEALENNNV